MTQLQRLVITFQPDATLEFAVTYANTRESEDTIIVERKESAA